MLVQSAPMTARATRPELWLFGLVVLMLSGVPTALYTRLFGFNPPASDAVLLVPVLGMMVLNTILRLRETVFGALALWTWTGIAALAALSTAWSVSPSDTVRESLILMVVVPYLGMVAGLADWRELLAKLWQVGLGLFAISLALYMFAPGFGQMQDSYAGALIGPFYEKNTAGQFLTWFTLVGFARAALAPEKGWLFLAISGAAMGALVLTQSATSLIAALAGTAVFVWVVLMRRTPALSIPTFLVTLGCAVPVALVLSAEGLAVLDWLGRSESLTGRIPIWQAIDTYSLSERPWRGHGYAAYWSDAYEFGRREYIYDDLGYKARHSHNSLVEMRLDLGWVGAALFLAAAAQAGAMALFRLRGSQGAYFALPFLAAVIPVGFAEANLVSALNWGGMLFILVLAKSTLRRGQTDRRSALWMWLNRLRAPQTVAS